MGDINVFKCNADSVSISSLCKCWKSTRENDSDDEEVDMEEGPDILSSTTRQSFNSIDEEVNVVARKSDYTDYSTLLDIDSTFVIMSKEGIISASGGKLIKKLFLNKNLYIKYKESKEYDSLEGQDVNEIWKYGYLKVFYAVYRKLSDGKLAQIGVLINNKEYKVCGNFSVNKKNKIDCIILVIRSLTASIDDIDSLLT